MDYDKQPCRDDDIYEEMDKFQPYELTTCITYEMAKRNELVYKKLTKLDLLIQLDEEHKYLQSEPSNDSIFHISEERWRLLKELFSLPSDDFMRKLSQMVDLEKSKAYDSLEYDKYINEMDMFDKKTKINSVDLYHMIGFFKEDLIHNHYIYPDSAMSKIPGSCEVYYFDHKDNSHINFMDLQNIYGYNGDFFYSMQHDGSTNIVLTSDDAPEIDQHDTEIYPEFEINTIIPTFKRRMYEPRTSLLALNFSKPLKENISYIESIYEHLNNSDEKIIKTPLESIGEDLNIDTINLKNMSAKEWSDCFFIYDFYNFNNSYNDDSDTTLRGKLIEIFNEYHGVKIKKSKSQENKDKNKGDNSKYKIIQLGTYKELKDTVYSGQKYKAFYGDTTIRERYKLIKSLIEKEKYKILLLKPLANYKKVDN